MIDLGSKGVIKKDTKKYKTGDRVKLIVTVKRVKRASNFSSRAPHNFSKIVL